MSREGNFCVNIFISKKFFSVQFSFKKTIEFESLLLFNFLHLNLVFFLKGNESFVLSKIEFSLLKLVSKT